MTALGRGYAVVARNGLMMALTACSEDAEAPALLAHFDKANPQGAPHRIARMVEESRDKPQPDALYCTDCGGRPGGHAEDCSLGDLAIAVPCEHHMTLGCIGCGGPDPDCDCDEAGEG